MADVAAGSSANLCSSDESSSDGEVEITRDEPIYMLQKLRVPKVSDRGRKRKIQRNSLEDYLEASIMLQFKHDENESNCICAIWIENTKNYYLSSNNV